MYTDVDVGTRGGIKQVSMLGDDNDWKTYEQDDVHIQYRLCTNVSSISHLAMLQDSIQEEENILSRPLSKITASDHNRSPDSCS